MAQDPSTDIAIPLPPRISLSEFAIIHRFLADIVKRRIDFRLSLVVSVNGGLEQYDQARNILRPLYSAQPITSATVALTPTYEDIYEVVLKIGAAGEPFTNKGVRSKTELSSATVSRALCELLRAGIIQRTRHVGLHFAEGGEGQLRRIIDGRLQKIAFLMHGAPGSGKSSYAETLGIAIVSRDKVRRIARGKTLTLPRTPFGKIRSHAPTATCKKKVLLLLTPPLPIQSSAPKQ